MPEVQEPILEHTAQEQGRPTRREAQMKPDHSLMGLERQSAATGR